MTHWCVAPRRPAWQRKLPQMSRGLTSSLLSAVMSKKPIYRCGGYCAYCTALDCLAGVCAVMTPCWS